MDELNLKKKISFLPLPENVKVMFCSACEIDTVHHRIAASNAFACWCGNVDQAEGTNNSMADSLRDAGYGEDGRF